MTLTVEAVFENGVLRPVQPLPLQEHEKVQIVVTRVQTLPSPIMEAYGIIGWKGDHETLEAFALGPELDLEESP